MTWKGNAKEAPPISVRVNGKLRKQFTSKRVLIHNNSYTEHHDAC